MRPSRVPGVLALLALLLAAPAAFAFDVLSVYDPAACADATDGGPLSDACTAMIAAFPEPPHMEPVPVDRQTLASYSFWKVGPDPVATFDGPGGNVTGEIPRGFNFVSVVNRADGWLQIEGNRWLRESDAAYASPSQFTGVTLGEDAVLPFAWVLDLSRIYVSQYPGGPRTTESGRWLRRYERVNIFNTVTDDAGWRWYMIGANQWVEQRFVSKVMTIERPEGVADDAKWVAVDLYEQTLVAYEGDRPVYATIISTGLPGTPTREGLFNVWAALASDGMSGSTGAPNAYALQRVPWIMYFDSDISLHGTYWHDYFGYRQSRGCVNLTVSDARWLFTWAGALDDREPDLPVLVYSSGVYGQTATGVYD